ncbi:hypothetical protein BGZ95_010318 [Linnemannia exigua]|uniref:DUF1264-domain-containing protein n=1 Tax=Linnemannia exigua TaxID=604196 RepID=A0AAD4DBU3_9FUNG|nr:hypothetical protein BGZ95_010318 [Linnemannia exigua]
MPIPPTHEADDTKGQVTSGASVLAAGSKPLQSFKPLSNICESFCGLHLYPNDNKRQIISYHYCSVLDEDRRQCLVYDSNSQNAKLIAVEYIISQKLFETLDDNEKKYWHSHKYECESGLLVQTSKALVPEMVAKNAEIPSLQTLVNTYGKTTQLWPVDDNGCCSSQIPAGPPQILVAFTADGQVNQEMLRRRDEAMKISTVEKRKEREGRVQGNRVVEGADQWITRGKAWQVYDHGDRGIVEARQ